MPGALRTCALAAVFVISTAAAFTQPPPATVTEFDPGLGVGVDLNRKVRLDFFAGQEKSDDLGSAKWKVSAGASFRLKPAFPTLLDALDSDKQHAFVIGTAYEYSRASESGGKTIEHKLMVDATARYAFAGEFLVSNRNRVEFRWVNVEYRFRYRNRMMFERRVKIKNYKITPYGAVEAFWDEHAQRQQQHLSKWNQFRFTGGATFPLFRGLRRTSLDIYFERAHCTTCQNTNTNILGVTLNVFFKRKK